MAPASDFADFTRLLDQHIFDDSIGIDVVLTRALEWFVDVGKAERCSLTFRGSDSGDIPLAQFGASGETDSRRSAAEEQADLSFEVPLDCGVFRLTIHLLQSAKTPSLQMLLAILSEKANVGFRFKEERRFERVTDEIVRLQLEGGLQPWMAWGAIAEQAIQFLPDMKPLIAKVAGVRCQILQYQPPKYLVLRASSTGAPTAGGVAPGDRQFIDATRVISGLPILQNKDYVAVNPRTDMPDLYGAYLFEGLIPQSEVAIVIRHDTQVIGVLNFEHLSPRAFDSYTVGLMCRAATAISPFVNALANREQRTRWKEKGTFYVIAAMIERLNGDLTHRVNNAVLRTRLRCEKNIKGSAPGSPLREEFEGILNDVEEIKARSQAFLADVPEYLSPRHLELSTIAADALRDACIEQRLDRRRIRFDVDVPSPCLVYASLLLRENVKNLIANSIIAVLDKLSGPEDTGGRIRVAAQIRASSDLQARDDLSPNRVYLEILDNGTGVPVDLLPKLREYGFTTRRNRGGTGFGLSAAIDYVQTVFGGDFEYENLADGGFRVGFYLLQYTNELQSALAPALNNQVEQQHV